MRTYEIFRIQHLSLRTTRTAKFVRWLHVQLITPSSPTAVVHPLVTQSCSVKSQVTHLSVSCAMNYKIGIIIVLNLFLSYHSDIDPTHASHNINYSITILCMIPNYFHNSLTLPLVICSRSKTVIGSSRF